MRYFRGRLLHNYRLRYSVSLPSSEWNRVVPLRINHQNIILKNFVKEKEGRAPITLEATLLNVMSGIANIDLVAQVALNPYGSSSACR
jgi:hypothetical protein